MTTDREIVAQMNAVVERCKLLFDKATVDAAIAKVGSELTRDLADKRPLMLSVMNGAVYFVGQLLPHCAFPMEVDYIHASRYRGETSGGLLNWLVKPATALTGRDVIIADDILDEGITLKAIVDYCYEMGARDVHTVVLADKQRLRPENAVQSADYTGLEVPNEYVVGSGMDYHEYLRNVPGIYTVHPDDM